jgi:hypothetical protein
MTQKTATPPALDAELAENIATIKRGVQAKVAEIKRDLAQWLDQTRHPSESAPVSIALLETACDRYLDTHDEQDARDLIERAFHRAVRKRRGPLQSAPHGTTGPTASPSAIPSTAIGGATNIPTTNRSPHWKRRSWSPGDVAAEGARKSGKTYLVARAACGVDAIYNFACDHPDALSADVDIMFEFSPDGQRIRRPALRSASRH